MSFPMAYKRNVQNDRLFSWGSHHGHKPIPKESVMFPNALFSLLQMPYSSNKLDSKLDVPTPQSSDI